ncbi:MAG: amidohydrolase family protein [Myxococcota bacterium]
MNALFSADSHVVEIEACYAEIDPRFRSLRPQAKDDPKQGAIMVVPGMDFTIPSGMLSRAGLRYEDWANPQPWSRIHPAAFDPKARLAIQDEEGVAGEVIYPSAGMVLCLHKDVAYRKACFEAYNRWLAAFCATDPKRLVGIGMVALPSPEEGVRELREVARQGFKGVMFCGDPAFEDYDHPSYAPIWEAAIELGLPVSFHILTGKDSYGMAVRGPKVIQQIVTVRGNQNIIMMMVLGGVFERHPELKVVMVENDAGWLPHFCFRLDHAWERHRWSMETGSISRKPSEYVAENVYTTFQDDSSVRWVLPALNLEHVMWATDFPHGDGTYPNSRRIADEVTVGMTGPEKHGVVYANARSLYGL